MTSDFQPGKWSRSDYGERLEIQADVVIIGAGAGGGASSCALAEGGLSVALLEEGEHWEPQQFKPTTPFALKHLYQEGGARAALGESAILVNGGRGVGGSTLINSAICFRTPDSILDHWREEHGCEGLTPAVMAPLLDRVWSTLGVIQNPEVVQRTNNLIFKKGAERLGLKGDFLYRSAPGCGGCALCQVGCPSGGKMSVDRSFIREALETERVGVYASCRVEQVETREGRIQAVSGSLIDPETRETTGSFRAQADHFILSGGTIGSPRFLLSNGLASDEHCGKHLYLHPATPFFGRYPFEIRSWTGVSQGYYVDCYEEGYLLQTATALPDQFYLGLPLPPSVMEAVLADFRYYALAGALVHDDDSVGQVGESVIRYQLGDQDRQRLIRGLRRGVEVHLAAGATSVLVGAAGVGPITELSSLEQRLPLDLPASQISALASHPMGTCRMGGDPEHSVLDPQGRVWGWDNLYVADASMFPSSLGVNPQVTTMAMALYVSERLLASS